MRWVLVLMVLALGSAAIALGEPPPVSWVRPAVGGSLEAPEGHAWIRWAADADRAVDGYLLERTSPGSATTVVRIADDSSFLSGLPEGTTEVRVRAVSAGLEGPWSERLRIEVSYPSRRLVAILGGLGSALLLATVCLIVLGHRRSARTLDRPEPGDG